MSYKLILAQIEPPWEEGDEGSLRMTDCSISELWDLSAKYETDLRAEIFSLVIRAIQSNDERIRYMLQQQGWVNMREMEDRDKKLVAQKKFFLLVPARSIQNTGFMQAYPIDPSHLTRSTAGQLAQGSEVVQLISKASLKELMTKESLEVYNRQNKSFKEQEDKRREAAKKRAETKKQKEIEKARKILEQAGVKE